MSAMWELARVHHHNLRDMDKESMLFRCFTCDSWFDLGLGAQLDRNFRVVTKGVAVCPIAQADLFDV